MEDSTENVGGENFSPSSGSGFGKSVSCTRKKRSKVVPRSKGMGDSFHFTNRRGKLNWKLLSSIDPDEVISNTDLEVLESITKNLTFSKIGKGQLEYIDPMSLLKIFRLSQLVIEYLLFIQNYLHQKKSEAEEDSLALVGRENALRGRIERRNATSMKLKLEVKKLKKTCLVYQLAFGASPEKAKIALQNLKSKNLNLSKVGDSVIPENRNTTTSLNQTNVQSDEMKTLISTVKSLEEKLMKQEEEEKSRTDEKTKLKNMEMTEKLNTLAKKNEELQRIIDQQSVQIVSEQPAVLKQSTKNDFDIERMIESRVTEVLEKREEEYKVRKSNEHQEKKEMEQVLKKMLDEKRVLEKEQLSVRREQLKLEKRQKEERLSALKGSSKNSTRRRVKKRKRGNRVVGRKTVVPKTKIEQLVGVSSGVKQLLTGGDPSSYTCHPSKKFPFLQSLFNHSKKTQSIQMESSERTIENYQRKRMSKSIISKERLTMEQYNQLHGKLRLDQIEHHENYQNMISTIKHYVDKVTRRYGPQSTLTTTLGSTRRGAKTKRSVGRTLSKIRTELEKEEAQREEEESDGEEEDVEEEEGEEYESDDEEGEESDLDKEELEIVEKPRPKKRSVWTRGNLSTDSMELEKIDTTIDLIDDNEKEEVDNELDDLEEKVLKKEKEKKEKLGYLDKGVPKSKRKKKTRINISKMLSVEDDEEKGKDDEEKEVAEVTPKTHEIQIIDEEILVDDNEKKDNDDDNLMSETLKSDTEEIETNPDDSGDNILIESVTSGSGLGDQITGKNVSMEIETLDDDLLGMGIINDSKEESTKSTTDMIHEINDSLNVSIGSSKQNVKKDEVTNPFDDLDDSTNLDDDLLGIGDILSDED